MSHSFDWNAELADAVTDAAGAWQFIRHFSESQGCPIGAGDGYGDEELRAAEVRLGFALPPALRALYALIGRRDDLTRVQDRLLGPDDLYVDDIGGVLVFRVENQAVTQWGIAPYALGVPDPPVVFWRDSVNAAEREWRPFMDRLSLAGVEMVLSEWMLSVADLSDNRELDEEAIAALEARFQRLPMPDYPMWALPEGPPSRWFSGLGAVIRDDAAAWLWARAGSSGEIAAVRRALPGEWLMAEGDG